MGERCHEAKEGSEGKANHLGSSWFGDRCGRSLKAVRHALAGDERTAPPLMSTSIGSPRRIVSLISHSSLSRTWKRDVGYRTGSNPGAPSQVICRAPHALDLSIMTKENIENKGSATFNPIIRGARRSLFMKPCATGADVVGEYSADGVPAVFVLPGMAASDLGS